MSVSYFNVTTTDWWKSLPAEIIPLPRGIYSEEEGEEQKLQRDSLVIGRLLEEVDFVEISLGPQKFDAILSSEETDCGKIDDHFHLEVALVADFDADGIGEVLVKESRSYQSETCFLGTGNNLGAGFIYLVDKDTRSAIPTLINFPNP